MAAVCACLLLPATTLAAAPEFAWSIGGTAEHSSNPGRTAEAEDSGVIRTIEAELNVLRESRSVDLALEVGAARTRYPGNTFDDESLYFGYGELDLRLVPESVTWVVRNRFAQVREAELAADTPDNRQNVNAFVTGPDLRLPLTAVDAIRLSLRYGRYDFSEADVDNERQAATVGIERRVSARTNVSLNAGIERVDFEDEADAQVDFDRSSAFVRAERALPRGNLGLDLGYNEVRRDGLDDVSGPLVRLDAERRLAVDTTIGLALTAATTDPVSGLASSPEDPLAARIDRVTVTGEVGQIRRGELVLDTRTGRAAWRAGVGTSRESFDDPDREVDRNDGRLALDWRLTARLSAYAIASIEESRFEPEATRERLVNTGIGLERTFGRNLAVRVGASRYDQSFDDANDDIRDDRLLVTMRYGTQRRLGTRESR